MITSKFSYDGPFPGSLKFSPNEKFLKLRDENPHWVSVAKEDGTVGCVPANFVDLNEQYDGDEILKYARNALEKINLVGTSVKSSDKQAMTKILKDILSVENIQPPCDEHPIDGESESKNASTTNESQAKDSLADPPPDLAIDLLSILRQGTNVSHSMCLSTLQVILQMLGHRLPQFTSSADQLYKMLSNRDDIEGQERLYLQTIDWHRLSSIDQILTAKLKNNQEAGWSLHETQSDSYGCLDRLNDLLRDADDQLIASYLQSSKLNLVSVLLQLFQRETAAINRTSLLRVIGRCCSIEDHAANLTLFSPVVNELVCILSNSVSPDSDKALLAISLRVFINLLDKSRELPVDLRCSFDESFIHQILVLIESPFNIQSPAAPGRRFSYQTPLSPTVTPVVGPDSELRHLATIFLLAVNLRYDITSPLIAAFKANPTALSHALGLIIQMFNREIDPVRMLHFTPPDTSKQQRALFKWAIQLIEHRADESSDFNDINDSASNIMADDVPDADESCEAYCAWLITTDALGERMRRNLASLESTCRSRTSVIKFLVDLLTDRQLTALIHKSDLCIIIDVIDRKLCDLEPDSEFIPDFITLIGLIQSNSSYKKDGSYRCVELVRNLERIADTYSSSNERSKDLAKAVLSALRDS